MKNSTWSGRFKKELDEEVLEFSESISIDYILFDSDIKVCLAHVEMLAECKIITKKECKTTNILKNKTICTEDAKNNDPKPDKTKDK